MKTLALTHGKKVFIDDSDFGRVSEFDWHIISGKGKSYAVRRFGDTRIRMHRFIMDCPIGMEVDHINGNGLDNRRNNLRICSHVDNVNNRSRNKKHRSSKYKGVRVRVREIAGRIYKSIEAGTTLNNKSIWLGCFKTQKDAALAFDKFTRRHRGEFAKTNFKEA